MGFHRREQTWNLVYNTSETNILKVKYQNSKSLQQNKC